MDIYLSHFICSYLDLGDEIYSIQDEVIEKRCIFTNDYDKDLVEYYYEAMQMDISEFQYMAFYRVIECIFDEVYKYETIQDVKYIINSDTFSSYDDKDIINIVEFHHTPFRARANQDLVKLIYVADVISAEYYEKMLGINLDHNISEKVMNDLDLTNEHIEAVIKVFPEELEKAAYYFSV